MELNEGFDSLGLEIERAGSIPATARQAIIVGGPHRSGTSALARVLSLVGCELPKHVMQPLPDNNELGFWEPALVADAHDAFLASIGSSWDDVAALPDGAFVSAAARELRQQLALLLHEEYGASSLFVVKDPRLSRLLPLWLAVLAELQIAPGIVLAVRNPLEVAGSLKARDGFTTTKSLLLWLRHTIESEHDSRGRPRSFVMYDELLRNWQGVVARVGEDLGVTWPGRSHRATVEIEHFLSERQRHHVFDWRDIEGRPDVVSWVKEAYFALRGSDPVQVLDQVRDELARADIAFGPILEEARLELDASREEILQGAAARDALGQDLEARNLALEARAAEVEQLRAELEERNSALAATASQAATHEAEIAALNTERERLAAEVQHVGDEVRRLAAAVEAAQERADAAEAENAGAREEVNAAYVEIDRLRTTVAEAVSRAETLEANASAEREILLADLRTARATIERLEGQAAGADAALRALQAQTAADRAELLQELAETRAGTKELTARILAAESEAEKERSDMRADLDAATAELDRLARELLDAQELSATADELLAIADAELEASRTERDQLQAELADALQSTAAALDEHERTAAAAAEESATRRAELEAQVTRLRYELETTRTDLEDARSEIALLHNHLATLSAERDAEERRLVAELEAARTHADGLAAHTAELEAAVGAHRALLDAVQSVTHRRTPRRRTLSQLGTWFLPPTRRKLHYLRRYLALRRSGEFDVDAYLLANPDVLATRINPLMHYVQYGCQEGRPVDGYIKPRNAMAAIEVSSSDAIDPPRGQVETTRAPASAAPAHTADLEAALSAHRALLRTLQSITSRRTARRRTLSQLATWFLPPTRRKLHYLRRYLALRRSGEFDVDSYLLANPDVLAEGINPLMHYVQYGCREGRAVDGYIGSNALGAATGHVVALTAGSAGAEERDDRPDQTTVVSDADLQPHLQGQTPGAASSVDDLIATAFPLLRPLRIFPTPTKQGRRLNLVTDSLNEGSLFGGVGTSIVLASLLAERLDASLRIITRRAAPNPDNFGVVLRAQGVEFDRNVEFVSVPLVGHESLPLDDRDLFLTTSWWSTWSTVRAVSPERVVYLIQEDERMFYPAGDEQAACSETIADSRIRFVVNTAMLRDHLVQEGFSNIAQRGVSFEPAFPENLYFPEARSADDPRRMFFFYARPNNVRNLFLHGVAAIDEAVSANILDPADWSFHFVGSGIPSVQLTRGVTPIVSENLPWPAYAALIRRVDLGLSLMSTPHPSYPPLDLAACGAVAVTNRYGLKQDLAAYSSNIICSDLSHDAIVEGIAAGVRLAQDRKTRQRNYEAQQLSRSWDASFSPVLDQLADWI